MQLAGWIPAIDGCTDYYLDAVNPLTTFADSCNQHDLCYRKIGKSKTHCDNEFRRELYRDCEEQYIRPVKIEVASTSSCKNTGFSLSGIGNALTCLGAQTINGVATVGANVMKVVELPGLPICGIEVEVYHKAVRNVGQGPYNQGQQEARQAAIEYKNRYIGAKSGNYPLPDNANVFSDDNSPANRQRTVDYLFSDPGVRDITIGVTPIMRSLALQDAHNNGPYWQYQVINKMQNNAYAMFAAEAESEADYGQEYDLQALEASYQAEMDGETLLQKLAIEQQLDERNATAVVILNSLL